MHTQCTQMLYVNPQSLAHEGILLEKQRLALDLTEDELRLSISKWVRASLVQILGKSAHVFLSSSHPQLFSFAHASVVLSCVPVSACVTIMCCLDIMCCHGVMSSQTCSPTHTHPITLPLHHSITPTLTHPHSSSLSRDPQLLTYSPAVLEARRLELAAALASMGLPCDWLALNSTYSGGPYGSYAVPRYTCRRSLEPLAAATAQSVSVSGERPVFAQTANASYDDVAWGGQGGEGGDSDDDGDVAGGLAGAGGQPSLPVPPLVMLPPVDEEAARKLARDVIAQRPSIVKRTDLVVSAGVREVVSAWWW